MVISLGSGIKNQKIHISVLLIYIKAENIDKDKNHNVVAKEHLMKPFKYNELKFLVNLSIQ
jgi:hypothetical protein